MPIIGDVSLVLVADDQRVIRKLVRRTLEPAGHTVNEATNGRLALELLVGPGGYDLLILDLNMPGVSGTDTLKLLRRDLPELAVIVITGFVSPESKQAQEMVSQYGVSRLLAKPFSTEELLSAVD